MSPVFVYREQYRQATSSTVGYDVIQKTPNTVNAEIAYTLLSGQEADYVGMANAYRRRLDAQGALPAPVQPQDHIPLFIQALMADQAKSLFGHTTKVFTTLEDVAGWTARLKDEGLRNLRISLYGFEAGATAAEKPAATSWRAGSAAPGSCGLCRSSWKAAGTPCCFPKELAGPMKARPKNPVICMPLTGCSPPRWIPACCITAAITWISPP